MENLKGPIGNLTRDITACGAVPKSDALYLAPTTTTTTTTTITAATATTNIAYYYVKTDTFNIFQKIKKSSHAMSY
jgi:hypothetical protein